MDTINSGDAPRVLKTKSDCKYSFNALLILLCVLDEMDYDDGKMLSAKNNRSRDPL